MRTLTTTLIVIVACIDCIYSQEFPTNPCPNVFRYLQNNRGYYGRVVFQNDYSGDYRLTVDMSVATLLSNDNQNIQLELQTSPEELRAGDDVVYNIYFPIQSVLPKPTRIEFNQNVYCTGPQEEVRPGRGVTNMWATTYQGVSMPARPIRRRTTTRAPPRFDSSDFSTNDLFSFNEITTWRTIPTQRTIRTTTRPIRTTRTTTPTTTTTTTTTTATTTTTTTPRSIQSNECGVSSVSIQQRIFNGEDIQESEYPWMAALMFRQDLNYIYRCTGSLVSNQHVVTAAHCVQFFNAPLVPVEDLLVVLGKVNLRNWANGAVIRDVENFTAHPDYKEKRGDGDIAVLKLKTPIEFQTSIRPVCLWQESDELNMIVGQKGTVSGWGRDETGKNFVAEAKQIDLPIVSQGTCLRSDTGFNNITSRRTFCAGTLSGSGPCTGDSGGGFVMLRNGRWTLRGVVSIALRDTDTCDLTKYSVYADLAKFEDWLRNALT